jgi:hypothetical protein
MIIAATIHGILTGQVSASWPDEFDAWCSKHEPRVKVLKKEYKAGPFPRFNIFKNNRLARGLAAEIELFMGTPLTPALSPGEREQNARTSARHQVWLIAHSNGCVVALKTARLLIARGIRVAGLILVGAAVESDVHRNGVLEWIRQGQVGRAIACSSHQDGVVDCTGFKRVLKWPYGDLGRVGWQLEGEPLRSHRIYTLWFTGGHSGYFHPLKIEETFFMFRSQMAEKNRVTPETGDLKRKTTEDTEAQRSCGRPQRGRD